MAAVCCAVLLMKYFFDRYGFTSSGAIAALVQGLLAKELWKRGLPKAVAGALHIPFTIDTSSPYPRKQRRHSPDWPACYAVATSLLTTSEWACAL